MPTKETRGKRRMREGPEGRGMPIFSVTRTSHYTLILNASTIADLVHYKQPFKIFHYSEVTFEGTLKIKTMGR
jgi:hypothetical protein